MNGELGRLFLLCDSFVPRVMGIVYRVDPNGSEFHYGTLVPRDSWLLADFKSRWEI